MSMKSKYMKEEYQSLLYTQEVFIEDFNEDGIYIESNKPKKKKKSIGHREFLRIGLGYDKLAPQDPFATMLISNFKNHILQRHPSVFKWKIIATLAEPDYVKEPIMDLGKEIYFFERQIGSEKIRVVLHRNKQSILYVVTTYPVIDKIDIQESEVLYEKEGD